MPWSFTVRRRAQGPNPRRSTDHLPTNNAHAKDHDHGHEEEEEEEEGGEEVSSFATFAFRYSRDAQVVFRRSGWTKVRPLCFWDCVRRALFVARHAAAVEHVDAALPDIADRGRLGLRQIEMRDQRPAHAAMRRHHAVALEALVPGADPDLRAARSSRRPAARSPICRARARPAPRPRAPAVRQR